MLNFEQPVVEMVFSGPQIKNHPSGNGRLTVADDPIPCHPAGDAVSPAVVPSGERAGAGATLASAIAIQANATAFGTFATADDTNAIATGTIAVAIKPSAIALGSVAIALKPNAVANDLFAIAERTNAIALVSFAVASRTIAVALRRFAIAIERVSGGKNAVFDEKRLFSRTEERVAASRESATNFSLNFSGGRPQGLPAGQGIVAGVGKEEFQRRQFDVAVANPNGIESFSPALSDAIGLRRVAVQNHSQL